MGPGDPVPYDVIPGERSQCHYCLHWVFRECEFSPSFVESNGRPNPRLVANNNQLSGLLNSSADGFSPLNGSELVSAKVSELVVMGGAYPSGYEYNFWGDNSSLAAHVINSWAGPVVYLGDELGANVTSGGRFMAEAPSTDPIRCAYIYYTYNTSRPSWDPLTILYAIDGLGDLFEYGNEAGYNYVAPNGSNSWVYDDNIRNQHWLKLKVPNAVAGSEIDRRLLKGARDWEFRLSLFLNLKSNYN